MNLKATDEIVGDPNRPKTRIVEGIYFQPAANLRAERLRYEMQPPFLFPPIQPQGNRQREAEAIMNLTQQQIDNLCGIPNFREHIEAAHLQALTHGIGWVSIDAAAGDSIAAVDLWAVPTEPENAATLREHADILTGCTENDPVMDSDRPGIAAMDNTGPAGDPLPADQRDELRDAWRKGSVWGQPPEPPPAPEPPPHNLGVIAPISGRVGGKWGA